MALTPEDLTDNSPDAKEEAGISNSRSVHACMTDAAFTVREAAAIAATTESSLRNWLQRTAICLVGEKQRDGRIMFTGHEVYVLRVARDLVAAGYPPHAAIDTSFRACDGVSRRKIAHDKVISFELDGPETGSRIVVPAGEYYQSVAETCECLYCGALTEAEIHAA